MNGSSHGIVRANGDVNVHMNPYDAYTLNSCISGNMSSPYSSLVSPAAGGGGGGGVIYNGATGLYGNVSSSSSSPLTANNRLHFSNSSRNSVNVTNNTCNSNLLHHQTSLSLSHSATATDGAAGTTCANIGPLVTNIPSSSSSITPIGNVISTTASSRLLDGNFTQSTSSSSSSQLMSNATNNLLTTRNHQPQQQQQQLHHASSLHFTSNSLGNTHVLPNSSLDVNASSPSSDSPQKKTFYLLIVLIAIGITIMLLTVVTAIVIFFKCKSFLLFLLSLIIHSTFLYTIAAS